MLALNYSILNPDTGLLDYGCGKGTDVTYCKSLGIDSYGWDPVYYPNDSLMKTDIVNLGYVVNVIEDYNERCKALKEAWDLTKKILIISARLKYELPDRNYSPYNDGCVTSWNTFQKFYDQHELREWIDSTLSVKSVAVEPGIFFVFRNEGDRQEFLAKRYQRKIAVPRLHRSEVLYEQHKDILETLVNFFVERGRLPNQNELSVAEELVHVFGGIKRAFNIIKRVTGSDQWAQITKERSQDLLVYLALENFNGRPHFSKLPETLQIDIKAFFSAYSKACKHADELLFSLSDLRNIDSACKEASYGKLTPTALYVHKCGFNNLSPILRLYEGCARALVGEVEEANILKLNRHKPKVSYLFYPDFEKNPHPEIKGSLVVSLDKRKIRYHNYTDSTNPFILHRKEEFIPSDHKLWQKFERLTKKEEKLGLFEHTNIIGTTDEWNKLLYSKQIRIYGHNVFKCTSLNHD